MTSRTKEYTNELSEDFFKKGNLEKQQLFSAKLYQKLTMCAVITFQLPLKM